MLPRLRLLLIAPAVAGLLFPGPNCSRRCCMQLVLRLCPTRARLCPGLLFLLPVTTAPSWLEARGTTNGRENASDHSRCANDDHKSWPCRTLSHTRCDSPCEFAASFVCRQRSKNSEGCLWSRWNRCSRHCPTVPESLMVLPAVAQVTTPVTRRRPWSHRTWPCDAWYTYQQVSLEESRCMYAVV